MKISSVDISQEEISEFDGKSKIISINRNQIDEIILKYGMAGERIPATIALGLILIAIGIVLGILPISHIIIKEYYEFTSSGMQPFVLAIPAIIIGAYLIKTLFERRYYLLVKLGPENRKIIFKEKVSYIEIEEYIKKVNKQFGYKIQLNE